MAECLVVVVVVVVVIMGLASVPGTAVLSSFRICAPGPTLTFTTHLALQFNDVLMFNESYITTDHYVAFMKHITTDRKVR